MDTERTYEGRATEELAWLLAEMLPSDMPADARLDLAKAISERLLAHPVLLGRSIGELGTATECVLGLTEAGAPLEDVFDGLVLGGRLTRTQGSGTRLGVRSLIGLKGYHLQRSA